jgi:hypothetical protein
MAASGEPPDLDALARDWITLWQSELTAIAADREAQESWQAILALWAGAAGAMLAAAPRFGQSGAGAFAGWPHAWFSPGSSPAPSPAAHAEAQPPHEPAAGRAGSTAPPGAAAAAAAPDPRDAEIDRLARHVGELESRLAELEPRLADIEHGVRRGGGGHRRGIAGPDKRRQRR